jgi:hypothetical protein
VDLNRPSGLRMLTGTKMEEGFASLLSAQTMFPVLSPDEMAGHYSENEISQAVRIGVITGAGGAWDLLTDRLEAIPEYRAGFDQAFGPGDIRFTQVSDAMAGFMELEWSWNGPCSMGKLDVTHVTMGRSRPTMIFTPPSLCSLGRASAPGFRTTGRIGAVMA